jgi:general secretion pathway protein A
MQSINREFGLPGHHTDTADLLNDLNQYLLEENSAGRTVVLVVDEAQNLGSKVLEQVRLISNLETERDKLIQIVLVGQPELRELLSRPELRQLQQRIGVNYHLHPMNLADTRDYITHRIEVAGRKESNLFTSGALQKIYSFSGGLPRLINLACDRALLLGYTRDQTPITAGMAKTAIADVRLTPGAGVLQRPFLSFGLALLVIVLLGAGLYALNRGQAPKPATKLAPAAAPATLSVATIARELAATTEKENTLAAFNVLAGIWRVSPVTLASPQPVIPEVMARMRGLDTVRFVGNLGALLRLDSPALLELALSGVTGRRFLALTGFDNGRYVIAPPLAGQTTLSGAELESIWSGRAYLPWKNHQDISPGIKPGTRGQAVSQLQELLKGAGFYLGPVTGVFDRPTLDAVRSFQSFKAVEADGVVGRQTLFLLYRTGTTFTNPSLKHNGGGRT